MFWMPRALKGSRKAAGRRAESQQLLEAPRNWHKVSSEAIGVRMPAGKAGKVVATGEGGALVTEWVAKG